MRLYLLVKQICSPPESIFHRLPAIPVRNSNNSIFNSRPKKCRLGIINIGKSDKKTFTGKKQASEGLNSFLSARFNPSNIALPACILYISRYNVKVKDLLLNFPDYQFHPLSPSCFHLSIFISNASSSALESGSKFLQYAAFLQLWQKITQ